MCSSLSVAVFVICIAMVARAVAVTARVSLMGVMVFSIAVAMCRIHGIAMVFTVVDRCFSAMDRSVASAVRNARAAPPVFE